jgi:hypothetical protein
MDKAFLAQYSNFSKEEFCEILFRKSKENEILTKLLSDSNASEVIKYWALLCNNLEKKLSQSEKDKSYHEHRANDLQRELLKANEQINQLQNKNAKLTNENSINLTTIGRLTKEKNELLAKLEKVNEVLLIKENSSPITQHYNTPSSKIFVKPTSTEENRAKKGGAKKGHKGSGRKKIDDDLLDNEITFKNLSGLLCQIDGHQLTLKRITTRCVTTLVKAHQRNIKQHVANLECLLCGALHTLFINSAIAKYWFDNEAIATLTMEVFGYHHSIGEIEKRFNINHGSVIYNFHKLAEFLLPIYIFQERELLNAAIVQMDETSWREDGKSSYCWNAITKDLSYFKFISSRSCLIPLKIFGVLPSGRFTNDGKRIKLRLEEQKQHKREQVIISDFYSGYNRLPISKQRCMEHFKRILDALNDLNGKNEAIKQFKNDLRPLVVASMQIDKNLSLDEYQEKAENIKSQIQNILLKNYNDKTVNDFQKRYLGYSKEFFQWVNNPLVDSHNNKCESSIRPIAISRAISKGSQAERGLITKSILTSVVATLEKRGKDPHKFIIDVLNEKNVNPDFDVVKFYIDYCGLNIDNYPLIKPDNYFNILPSPNGEYAGEYPLTSATNINNSYLTDNFDWQYLNNKYNLFLENDTVKLSLKNNKEDKPASNKAKKDKTASNDVFFKKLDDETISKIGLTILDLKNKRETPYDPKTFNYDVFVRVKQNSTRAKKYASKKKIPEKVPANYNSAGSSNSYNTS